MRTTWLLTVLVLLCAVAGSIRSEEEYPRKFGKTNAQILALGFDRWMDFQGERAGQSTAGMSEGMAAYRSALRWRNDRLAAKASPTLRRRIAALRPLLVDYTGHLMEVGAYVSGGGTIWSNIHAGTLSESEETLYALLSAKEKVAKPHTTGMVKRELDEVSENIAANAKESYNTPEKTADARKELSAARAAFAKIAALAAKLDRRSSDHILAFCTSTAETAESGGQ